MIKGIDALGLAMHDGKMLAEVIPHGYAIGFLAGTFGDAYPNLKRILDTGKISAVRAHLCDGTCIRNRVCEIGAPTYDDLRTLRARAEKLQRVMSQYPGVKLYVSPWLEHDCKDRKLVNKWFSIVRSACPTAKLVCSAFTGHVPTGVLIEKHGGHGSADIVSPDGVAHTDLDLNRFLASGKEIVFSWMHWNNGRKPSEAKFIMPKQRKNWPSRKDIEFQINLLNP